MSGTPITKHLADYLLGLYEQPGGRPEGIVADLWRRGPEALEVVLRHWHLEDRVADAGEMFMAFATTTTDLRDVQDVVRTLAYWTETP